MVEIIYGAQNENHENVIKVQSTHTQQQNETQHSARERQWEWEGRWTKMLMQMPKSTVGKAVESKANPTKSVAYFCAETAL